MLKLCEVVVLNKESEIKVSENKDTKVKKSKWEIKFIPERCKGCTYCIEFCPRKVLGVSPQINSKGYHIPFASKPEACIGCKMCEIICPDFAIFVEKKLDSENK